MAPSTFRWFLLGYGLDRTADMLWTTTLAWLASLASSPALSGTILAAAFLPHVAALLLGGVQADRRAPAAITRMTTVAKMLLLAALLAAQGALTDSLLVVAVIAALLAAVDGFHDPAVEAWGMHLRPPEEQPQAVAAEATIWRVAQSLGAAAGGVLVGIGAVYALAAGVVLLALARATFAVVGRRHVLLREEPPDGPSSSWTQIRAGVSFLRRHPVLPTTLSVQVTTTLISGAMLILLLPAVIREHGWPAALYGAATMSLGIGLIVGSSVVLRDMASAQNRRITNPVRVALVCAVVANVPLIAITAIDQPVWLVADVALYGLLLGPVGPLLGGYRRRQTPRSMSGVVAAATKLLLTAPEPLGPLLVGLLAAAAGLRPALLLCAAVSTAPPIAGLVRLRMLQAKVSEIRGRE